MGCFLGCFGGEKDPKRDRKRNNRVIPKKQRKGFQNVQQQSIISADQSFTKITPTLVTVGEELLSPSPRKRVTFDSNVTTYEHVLLDESTDSLRGDDKAFKKEKEESLKTQSQHNSLSEDNTSVISSVASYPPNHRYHNVRDNDDEAEEEYGDSDLDDLDDYDDEDDHDDYDIDIDGQEVWAGSVLTSSRESTTENSPARPINEEVESRVIKTCLLENEFERLAPKTNARDRSVYVNSVLNPIENITQWKAVKSKGTKPQKENFLQGSDQSNYQNQEIAVNASLSNWLVPSEASSAKKMSLGELETMSQGSNSVLSFEDRPILGALMVDELKQISASSTPRKSSNRSFDEMHIIGTVGTYWNHLDSAKSPESVSSHNGIPNTSSKYKEVFVK